jgi:hypothetical protein
MHKGATVFSQIFLFFSYGVSTLCRVMVSPYRDSRSHSDTPHSVGLLWTSDHSDAATSASEHNIQNRQTSLFPTGFGLKIPASEQPQIHALNRSATGIGRIFLYMYQNTRRHITENCDLVTWSLAISKKRMCVEWRSLKMKRWGEFLELKKDWSQLHNGQFCSFTFHLTEMGWKKLIKMRLERHVAICAWMNCEIRGLFFFSTSDGL